LAQINITVPCVVISPSLELPPNNAFAIAAQYLQDATQVDRIMEANPNLGSDPWWSTITTIVLPPVTAGAGTGGIIGL